MIHMVNVHIALRYLNGDMDEIEKFEFEELKDTPYMQKALSDATDEFFLLYHNFDLSCHGVKENSERNNI